MSNPETCEHMEHPQPGDRFHEMKSFWVEVIVVDTITGVIVVHEHVASTKEKARIRVFMNTDEFRRAYAYGQAPVLGYWIRYEDTLPVEELV